MAIPRYEDRVHSGVGQSSAFICPSLALCGLKHKAEFTRPFRFERIGFAPSFRLGAVERSLRQTKAGFRVAESSFASVRDEKKKRRKRSRRLRPDAQGWVSA